jgi:hypothetical protein
MSINNHKRDAKHMLTRSCCFICGVLQACECKHGCVSSSCYITLQKLETMRTRECLGLCIKGGGGSGVIYVAMLQYRYRLCGLVVRVPGYTTEMYCVSCEVRTEFICICYVEESRPSLWSSGQSSWLPTEVY